MIVAIDGPAASGKGTIGRLVAGHFGFPHLDTGLLYRAVAAAMLGGAIRVDDEPAAIAFAADLSFADLDEARLSVPAIGTAASRVATLPGLRAALMARQRSFAAQEPGAVLVGRDIGTIVCPSAEAKIYLTASVEARAARRASQLGVTDPGEKQAILEAIQERDRRDTTRELAPLRQAEDARLLDTTDLDIEASFRAAVALVDQAVGSSI